MDKQNKIAQTYRLTESAIDRIKFLRGLFFLPSYSATVEWAINTIYDDKGITAIQDIAAKSAPAEAAVAPVRKIMVDVEDDA